MKTIVITKQEELDALPKSFDEFTVLELRVPVGNTIVVPYHRGSSRVVARESSSVVARGSSSVEAWESSSVEAWGSSRVVARESSSVVARGSSSVEAWESSSVEAWGSSSVVARGSSSVEARESSSVVARESSSVVAWENVIIRCLSGTAVIKVAHDSTAILQDCQPKITVSDRATVICTKKTVHTHKTFCEMYEKDGALTLYKVTRENGMDHHTGTIKYDGVVECPDWNPDPSLQCGNGLHLSPTPEMALRYHSGPVLKCRVLPVDIVVYSGDITKVRCRKVEVIGPWKP